MQLAYGTMNDKQAAKSLIKIAKKHPKLYNKRDVWYAKMIKKCKNNYKTEYYYLLNSWYKRNEYDDVKRYIISVGCKYFINKINFKQLGIC